MNKSRAQLTMLAQLTMRPNVGDLEELLEIIMHFSPNLTASVAMSFAKKLRTRERMVSQIERKAFERECNEKLADTDISGYVIKKLADQNITTIGDLLDRTPDDLLAHRGFGGNSIYHVQKFLGERGLALRGCKIPSWVRTEQ